MNENDDENEMKMNENEIIIKCKIKNMILFDLSLEIKFSVWKLA